MAATVFVGIATLDVVQYDAETIRPGHKTVSGWSWLGAGGPATNAAICCAHLTGAATLITALGSGPAADLVRSELQARDVEVIDCAPTDFTLPAAAITVTRDGERTVVSPGAVASTVTATPEAVDLMTRAEVLLVDGHHPGLGEAARARMPERGSAGRPLVVADAGSVKPVVEDWLTGWIDVLAGSEDYADGLGRDADAALRHGLDRGAGAVVVTRGADELLWALDDGSAGSYRPMPVQARDTLGAGDAFHGALVAALGRAENWRTRLPSAVAMAAGIATSAVADPTARGWLTDNLRGVLRSG